MKRMPVKKKPWKRGDWAKIVKSDQTTSCIRKGKIGQVSVVKDSVVFVLLPCGHVYQLGLHEIQRVPRPEGQKNLISEVA